MSAIYADRPCADPAATARACAEQGVPTTWHTSGMAPNQMRNPQGRGPGEGWVLLTLADLQAIDQDADHDLTFMDDRGNERTLQRITLVRAECVTPGWRGDGRATFLCHLADRRWQLARLAPVNKAYNVRDADGTGYLTESLNSGSAWTWQEVVQDLWTVLGLGTAPTLPYTFTDDPENLRFEAVRAWEAVNRVLDILACTVKYDQEADEFTFLKLGDTAADGAVAAAGEMARLYRAAARTWDGYHVEPNRGKLPEKIRVYFPRRPQPQDGSSTLYAVDVTLPSATGVVTGSFEVIHGDLTAIGTGTPTNASTLSTRASEIADAWRRKRLYAENRITLVYRDFQDAPKLLAETTGAVAYDDRGGVMGTEVMSRPDGLMEAWRPWLEPLTLTNSGSGSGDTDCSGAAGWQDGECLLATLAAAAGTCAGATVGQTVHLAKGTPSVETFTINGMAWTFSYSWTVGACCPTASLVTTDDGGHTVTLTPVGCSGGKVRFTTADPLVCPGATAACQTNKLVIEVECVAPRWWCVSESGSGSGSGVTVVSACVEPAGAIDGPYDTAAEAEAACLTPWWCTGSSLPGTCAQSATEPADSVAGPFTTEADCTDNCATIIGWNGPGWYCVWNGTSCDAVELIEGDQYDPTIKICSGAPYADEATATAACAAFCCPVTAVYQTTLTGVSNGTNSLTGNPTVMTPFNRLWDINYDTAVPGFQKSASGFSDGGIPGGSPVEQTTGVVTVGCTVGGDLTVGFKIGATSLAVYSCPFTTCEGDFTLTLTARSPGQIELAPGFPPTITLSVSIP